MELSSREGAAIGRDRGREHRHDIKVHPLGAADRFLDPGGSAHGDENRVQTFAPVTRACDVLAGRWGNLFGFEIVQRRAHDGERRADLVGELAGERSQVAGVFVQPRQERRETARNVAQFIAGAGFRESS